MLILLNNLHRRVSMSGQLLPSAAMTVTVNKWTVAAISCSDSHCQ